MKSKSLLLGGQLLQAFQRSPASLELFRTLLKTGKVDLNEPVDEKGTGLMDALVDRALHHGPSSKTTLSPMFKGLFGLEVMKDWLEASDGQAFARKDRNGQWVPLAVMNTYKTARKETIQPGQGSIPTTVKKGDIEKWLVEAMKSLPESAWEDVGSQFLELAFEMDLSACVHAAWGRVPVLRLGAQGRPALMSAKRAMHWERFINEGGSLDDIAGDQPLWRGLLEQCRKGPACGKRGKTSFLGAFEQAFLARCVTDKDLPNKNDQKALAQHVKSLVFARLGTAQNTTPEHWVEMFRAAEPDWVTWTDKTGRPIWQAVGMAHKDLAFFQALEKCPAVLAQLNPEEFGRARMWSAMGAMAQMGEEQSKAVEQFLGLIKQHGWVTGNVAGVTVISELALGLPDAKKIQAVAELSPEAWWGADDKRQATERGLFFQLPRVKPKAASWLILTQSTDGGPWLAAAHALAMAMKSKMEPLMALGNSDQRVVASDPEARAVLKDLHAQMPTALRKRYMAWLKHVDMELATPVSAASTRSTPRL